MKCTVDGCCNEKYHSKLYCSMHYRRLKFTGTLDGGKRERLPLIERFWKYVDKNGNGCWLWIGACNSRGYGLIGEGGKGGKSLSAHRYSYTIHKGGIPDGLVVMHSCDTPNCVNPNHLSLGTPKDNTQDAVRKGRIHNGIRPTKLTAEQALFIKEHLEYTGVDLARMFGVGTATINAVRTGRSWKNITTDIEYPGRRPKLKKVMPCQFGDQHPKSKLTLEQAKYIKAHPELKHTELADMFGLSPNCIRGVRIGRTWKEV